MLTHKLVAQAGLNDKNRRSKISLECPFVQCDTPKCLNYSLNPNQNQKYVNLWSVAQAGSNNEKKLGKQSLGTVSLKDANFPNGFNQNKYG